MRVEPGREPHQPTKGQLEFDWTRGHRRTLIERIILPPFARVDSQGRKTMVRTARSKYLLRVLESYARDGGPCFLKLETIARAMGKDERSACRAIADCVDQGLLTVDRSFYKHSASRYEINWGQVREFILANPETEGLINLGLAAEQRAVRNNTRPERSTVAHENLETTHDKLSVTHDILSSTHDKLSVTHDNLSQFEAASTSIPARAVLNHCFNHERKPEIKPCSSGLEKSVDFAVEEQTGGWPHPIELHHLQNRDTIHRLWEHALTFHFLNVTDRVRFFTLAKYVSRMTIAREVRNAGAYFTAQVKAKRWLGDDPDIRAAVNALSIIDGARGRRDG